jgi:hypothetical protein
VIDPKAAQPRIATGERKAAGGLGVRKERGIEIESQVARLRPIDPAREMLGRQLIALYFFSAILGIDGVQIEPMLAGNEPQCLLEVRLQLGGVSCPARIIAGGLDASAGQPGRAFKAADVVSLPALQRNCNSLQRFDGTLHIDADYRVSLAGQPKTLLDRVVVTHASTVEL